MSVTEAYLSFILDQFSDWGDVSSRRMFGGAGLYRNGKMFGLVSDDVAYLKVNESNVNEFITAGSNQFKPYEDKNTVMSYYEIPSEVIEHPDILIEWATRSLQIQLANTS
ncbi:MAG: TfoX/Sxy family protein [Lentisphaeria bacterium]|nr:TfoX/Sxy family protein [Lentisphaeria bacterium]